MHCLARLHIVLLPVGSRFCHTDRDGVSRELVPASKRPVSARTPVELSWGLQLVVNPVVICSFGKNWVVAGDLPQTTGVH
mmetsp:Transcript_2291/g.5071  ORF Transcript_2291/g.5071 Transcript_2291/m.5071 type:complete len:80 (+) Transcript_2291:135-374(+)